MKKQLPRLHVLLSLGVALLGSGLILWLASSILTNRAWKSAYLRHMAKTIRTISMSARLPRPGTWTIHEKKGIKLCVISLERGDGALRSAMRYLGISPDMAATVLYKGGGAACVDRDCKTVVAGARIRDPLTSQVGAVIMVQSGTNLYRLMKIGSVILVLTLILVGFTTFLLAYLLLYLWQIRPYLELVKEIEKIEPVIRGLSGPKRPESAIEIIRLLRKAYVEERTRSRRMELQAREVRNNLLSAQDSLLRSEKLASVGVLAAGLAHEIGNPVGIIMGLSDLIANEDISKEEAKEYAASVLKSANRVHRVIQDLLTFARPVKEEGERTDVNITVMEATNLLRPQSGFRNINMVIDLPDTPIFAEIKPSQLQQVIVNLMLNAADAMQGKGRLVIRAGNNQGRISIEIRDDGPGIPKDVLSRIWEPFFTTKDVGKGTGLGLPMSLRIINAYGGDIRVKSIPGQGAEFTVYLWEVE